MWLVSCWDFSISVWKVFYLNHSWHRKEVHKQSFHSIWSIKLLPGTALDRLSTNSTRTAEKKKKHFNFLVPMAGVYTTTPMSHNKVNCEWHQLIRNNILWVVSECPSGSWSCSVQESDDAVDVWTAEPWVSQVFEKASFIPGGVTSHRKLERHEKIVGFPKAFTNRIDLVDQILQTDDAMFTWGTR